MKNLFIFSIFSLLVSDPHVVNQKHSHFFQKIETLNKLLNDSCEENHFKVILSDIKEDDFTTSLAYTPPFIGSEKDSLKSLTYNSYRKPTTINTSKKRIVFNNISPDYEDRQENYFDFGYNKQIGKHLIYAVYYETGEYFLIDNITNHIDTLQSYPYFSSNFEYIFTFFINPYLETEINGKYPDFVSDIVIYKKCNKKFKPIFKKSYAFIPKEIKWGNNNTLLIKASSSGESYKKTKENSDINNDFIYRKIQILNSKEVNNENTLVKYKSNNYTFIFEGTEPFWKLKFNNDSITINMYDDTIVKKEVFFSEKSINGNTIGFQNDIISGIINETWDSPCMYAVTEQDSLNYEIYFIYRDRTYKGCGYDIKNSGSR